MLQHHVFSVNRYQVIKVSQRSSIQVFILPSETEPATHSQFRSGSLGQGQWECSDGEIMDGDSDRCQQVGKQIMEK